MNIAKVDAEERGRGGDGLAKDIHRKSEGPEVTSVGFSFNPPHPSPPVPLERLPRRLRRKKMACLALKINYEEIVVSGHFCAEVIT